MWFILKGALSKRSLIKKFASKRIWKAWVEQVARATYACGPSAARMQTADKRPRLFERSEFLDRPPCILSGT